MGIGIKRKCKNAIKILDKQCFAGKISRRYSAFKLKHGEQIYNFYSKKNRRFVSGRKLRIICQSEIPINDLFLAQYYDGDYTKYKHMDAAVRLLAIEEYYGKNNYGFGLYRRMQAGSGFDWTDRFRNLIQSYEKNGYQEESNLELDQNLAIMDGSHRATLAYYHGKEFVNAKMFNCERDRNFDIDKFWKDGFSAEECHLIQERAEQILDCLNYEFVGVIWSPAYHLADDIINDMNQFEPDDIEIAHYKDYKLERGDFVHIFKALYYTDILDESGMDEKIRLIDGSMPEDTQVYPIRVYYLHINNPRIGVNPKNGTPQSQVIKRLKSVFRTRFKDRVKNYQYDVLMHVSDNYLQSKFCRILFEIDRDISGFFEQIKDREYVILRAKESRQHTDFPKSIYFRSDSDILVRNIEIAEQLSDIAYDFAEQHFSYPWISIEKEADVGEIKIIVRLHGFMVYMFEFRTTIYGLNQEFADMCLGHAIAGDFYKYLPDSDEVIIRILEYIHKPQKKWYRDYISKNRNLLDESLLFSHIDTSVVPKKKVKKVLEELQR